MSKAQSGTPDHQSAVDRPIESRDADSMGRRDYAEQLARELLAAPMDEGYVVALTGAWGSGKTSILNMTVDAVGEYAIVIHFNPWMFSGTEALVSAFFREVSKQLRQTKTAKTATVRKVAKKLAIYGQLLSPVAGMFGGAAAVGAVSGLLAQIGTDPSVYEEHASLRQELVQLGSRLVVVLDDVDRLQEKEVRDLVRLVRLVGDFPNTLYLLAFDRARVEECLGEGDIARGRAYLEKIVQVTYDVPLARDIDLTKLFVAGLEPILESATVRPLHREEFQNIFTFVIKPLFRTPRDVRRYLQALPMTLRMIGDEVALADVLGLEAIRVLRPDMFDEVVAAHEALCTVSTPVMNQSITESPMVGLAAVDHDLASALCKWLFPASGHYFDHSGRGSEWPGIWRTRCNVASLQVLCIYLERRLPEDVVPARIVDGLLERLSDHARLKTALAALEGAQLSDALERLVPHIADLPYDAGAPLNTDPASVTLATLLDQLPRMSARTTDNNPFGRRRTIGRLSFYLVRRIADDGARVEVVRTALGEANVISARIIMLQVLGHRPDVGLGILPEAVIEQLEEEQRKLIAALPAEDLAKDPTPLTIARLLAESADGRVALAAAAEDARFMIALLKDACTTVQGRDIGAAAVDLTDVLSWDLLAILLGNDLLIRRIAELFMDAESPKLSLDAEEHKVLNLAGKYATGWRPNSLGQAPMQAVTGGTQVAPNSDDEMPELEQ